MTVVKRRWLRRMSGFVLTLLAVELLDELVFGTREAAWPLIRDDLGLTYVQIGLLVGSPGWIATFIEPVIGILGDTGKRRALIVGGGIIFALATISVGLSQVFWVLLLVEILTGPASGAFVNLSQAALMDHDPARHEQNMARWGLAGSLGQVVGPLLLGVIITLGGTWRHTFILYGLMMLGTVVLVSRFTFSNGKHTEDDTPLSFMAGLRNALSGLRRREIVRWLLLLEFSNLLLDILLSYLALYFVDVVGVNEGQAGLAVAIFTGVGLIGDVLLIPLLERVRGLTFLRISSAIEVVLYAAFLLVEPLSLKFIIIALVGFFNSGAYAILQGQLYSAMPGQSGTVMALNNVGGLVGNLFPFIIGLLAQQFGLGAAMWFLLLGPLVLLLGIPRSVKS